jgi:hypothetical protein
MCTCMLSFGDVSWEIIHKYKFLCVNSVHKYTKKTKKISLLAFMSLLILHSNFSYIFLNR